MPKAKISERLLDALERLAESSESGDFNSLLDIGSLPPQDREPARLFNRILSGYRAGDVCNAYRKESEHSLGILRREERAFPAARNESFGLIAGMAGIDRISVFRNAQSPENGLRLSQIYHWRQEAGGTIAVREELTDITYADLSPRWESALAAGECIRGLARLMPESHRLARFGCVSLLAVPIFNNSAFWGFILYEKLTEAEFTVFETDVLRSASFMLANEVMRNEEAAAIREADTRVYDMLQAQAHWYKSILDATPLPVSVTDTNGNWSFVNKAMEKFLGRRSEELLGKPCSEWNSPICDTGDCGMACVKRGISQTCFDQDGMSYQVDVGILRNLEGENAGFVEIVQDITEIKNMARRQMDMETSIFQLQSEVEKNSYDPLTGSYSRRFFEESMERLISILSRSRGTLSLMMVDIDYFKQYNDTYGHLSGDDCLKTVAESLQACMLRKDDFVARYGGEEFVVILPNTGEDGARKIADKMLQDIRSLAVPHAKSAVADCVTVSIGVVTGRVRHTHDSEDFLKRADELLYASKQGGRDRYTFARLQAGAGGENVIP